VNLTYEAYTYVVPKGTSEVVSLRGSIVNGCDGFGTAKNSVCTRIEQITGQRIKQISNTDHSNYITFNYSQANRLDLDYSGQHQGNYLANVVAYRNAKTIKTVNLNFDYFNSGTSASRLKLISVKEDDRPAYQFSYAETYPLPDRLSYSQDYWGYYNGKSNGSMIPAMPVPGWSGGDRSPDFNYAQAFALKTVRYPTGGHTDFEYEPHFSNIPNSGTAVYPIVYGGLRIKSVKNYDTNTHLASLKSYVYEWTDELQPLPSDIYIPSYLDIYYVTNSVAPLSDPCQYPLLSSNPVTNISDGNDNYLDYSKVTEMDNTAGANGRTIYYYRARPEDAGSPLQINAGPIKKGTLIDKMVQRYDAASSSFKNVHRTKYSYRALYNDACIFNPAGCEVNQTVIPNMRIVMNTPASPNGQGGIFPAQFSVYKYYFVSCWTQLLKTEESVYGPDGASQLTTTTNYTYGNPAYIFPTVIETANSRGKLIRTENKYVPDIAALSGSAPVYTAMKNANIIEPLIEQKTTNVTSGQQLSFKRTNFASWSSNVYKPSSIETALYGSGNKTEIVFQNYDTHGNILAYAPFNQLPVAFKWSTDFQYVVAEAKNAKSNEIMFSSFEDPVEWGAGISAYDPIRKHSGNVSAMIYAGGSAEVTAMNNNWLNISLTEAKRFHYSAWVYSTGPGADVFLFMKRAGETGYFSYVDNVTTSVTGSWVLVEKDFLVPADVTQLNIRIDNNGAASGGNVWFDDVRLHPTDAQMTTFTYEPSVGVTSATDTRGNVVTYEYDIFRRLINVKDQKGNIVKHTDYHYQGE
jgi:YD repeat-containing protein